MMKLCKHDSVGIGIDDFSIKAKRNSSKSNEEAKD